MKNCKKKKVHILYLRKVELSNYDWIKRTAKENGYCPSTLINRLVEHTRHEKNFEML